jgi:N-hydroxyarylamine O-acetyltransferase
MQAATTKPTVKFSPAANFNLTDYCARIGYSGELRADLACLRGLMRAQLCSVPFENLDVQAGKVVSMVPEDIVEKIVYQQRGGYCYEVSGLFAMALSALGIDYDLIGARPMFYPTRRPKTHMVLLVYLAGEQWLCDLGFGNYGMRAPIGLHQLQQPQVQDDDCFQLVALNDSEFALQARVNELWVNQFCFDLYRHEWLDFMPANFMNSTHPEAIFVKQLLVVLHTARGRKILSGTTLRVIDQGVTTERQLSTDEVSMALVNEFHLTV